MKYVPVYGVRLYQANRDSAEFEFYDGERVRYKTIGWSQISPQDQPRPAREQVLNVTEFMYLKLKAAGLIQTGPIVGVQLLHRLEYEDGRAYSLPSQEQLNQCDDSVATAYERLLDMVYELSDQLCWHKQIQNHASIVEYKGLSAYCIDNSWSIYFRNVNIEELGTINGGNEFETCEDAMKRMIDLADETRPRWYCPPPKLISLAASD